jgi:hypothetical protein
MSTHVNDYVWHDSDSPDVDLPCKNRRPVRFNRIQLGRVAIRPVPFPGGASSDMPGEGGPPDLDMTCSALPGWFSREMFATESCACFKSSTSPLPKFNPKGTEGVVQRHYEKEMRVTLGGLCHPEVVEGIGKPAQYQNGDRIELFHADPNFVHWVPHPLTAVHDPS